jgi:hypothetical protein
METTRRASAPSVRERSQAGHVMDEPAAAEKSRKTPSAARKLNFYLSKSALEEFEGSENRSQRLDQIARGYDLMRRALCPKMSLPYWHAVFGALVTPLPPNIQPDEIATVIADRLDFHADKVVAQLGFDPKPLIKLVRKWPPEVSWAVADNAMRFWRMSNQIPLRQKLALLGITVEQ